MFLLDDPQPVLIARLAVAMVLVHGAISKCRHRLGFAGVIADYRIVPGSLASPLSFAIPAMEMLAALLLMAVPLWGAWVSAILLLSVTTAVTLNLLRGRTDIDCGCGDPALEQKLSWAIVARNLLLLLICPLAARHVVVTDLPFVAIFTITIAGVSLFGVYMATNRLMAMTQRLATLKSGT